MGSIKAKSVCCDGLGSVIHHCVSLWDDIVWSLGIILLKCYLLSSACKFRKRESGRKIPATPERHTNVPEDFSNLFTYMIHLPWEKQTNPAMDCWFSLNRVLLIFSCVLKSKKCWRPRKSRWCVQLAAGWPWKELVFLALIQMVFVGSSARRMFVQSTFRTPQRPSLPSDPWRVGGLASRGKKHEGLLIWRLMFYNVLF